MFSSENCFKNSKNLFFVWAEIGRARPVRFSLATLQSDKALTTESWLDRTWNEIRLKNSKSIKVSKEKHGNLRPFCLDSMKQNRWQSWKNGLTGMCFFELHYFQLTLLSKLLHLAISHIVIIIKLNTWLEIQRPGG